MCVHVQQVVCQGEQGSTTDTLAAALHAVETTLTAGHVSHKEVYSKPAHSHTKHTCDGVVLSHDMSSLPYALPCLKLRVHTPAMV